MKTSLRLAVLLSLLPVVGFFLWPRAAVEAQPATKGIFQKGDRVVFMGDTFAEREGMFGYIETMIQSRLPELGLTFRNLAYPADTPAVLLADMAKGDTETNREANRALNFGTMPKHLTDAKADVILLCFGMNDSFRGPAGVEQYTKELQELMQKYGAMKFNGKSEPRFVLVGPIAHENLGGDFIDPSEHNRNLKLYSDAMAKLADKKIPFIDLYSATASLSKEPGAKLTFNGIHLTQYGYWAVSQLVARQLDLPVAELGVDLEGKGKLSTPKIDRLPGPPPPAKVRVHESLARLQPQIVQPGLREGKFALCFEGTPYVSGTSKEFNDRVSVLASPYHDQSERLRHLIVQRNEQFFYKWRAVNGEYVYGRRAKPFGVVNFPAEMEAFNSLAHQLDDKIAGANKIPAVKSMHLLPTLKDVKPPVVKFEPARSDIGVYQQKQGLIGGKEFETAKDPKEAIKYFKLQEGYEINLFASEKDFPLHDPLAINFDSKGRCWVTTMPSYPHNIPGVPPNDKIIILEDTNGDGKADKHSVFAEGLYLPTGFEFGQGGVFVAAQPNLLFLKDTDGDGKADVKQTILHGFGTGDSHHAMHMFFWGPDGGLYFHEGIFHRTNTETPYGPLRQRDAGIYRFQPRNFRLETFVSYNFANPWGQVFDRWGQNFIADASGGANYFGLPLTGHVEFPRQHNSMKVFTSVVRPTCGCELISSRHFPPEAQGNFLVNNNIGFQGIKQHKVSEDASGFTSKELEPLLFSTDRNFRPVGITFGPDGALYVVDWFNPLIGHMQFSLRDPNRDHFHGRIWRITAKNRPLVQPAKIDGEPIAKLLDLLKEYEDRTRYRARSELRERKREDVAAALPKWIASLKEDDANHEHQLLEALWVYQTIDVIEPNLLKRLLHAKDYHARAAATRALRHWRERIPDALDLLTGQANDVHPRVRLEAVIALSYFPTARAAEIALECLKHPMDYYLDYGLKETMATLEPAWKPLLAAGKPFAMNNPAGANFVLGNVATGELVKMARSGPVYVALLSRDGVLPQYRQEALEGLAKLNKTDYLSELFTAIERLDRAPSGHSEHVLHDLGHLLTSRKQSELAALKTRLEKLAAAARMPLTRQVAYVALATAEGSVDRLWQDASQSAGSLRDLVDAVPIIPDAKLRASTYGRVQGLLKGIPKELEETIKKTKGTRGRFVRIELPGARRTLTLAEVQVFAGGVNVALKGKASQVSTDFKGDAQKAIDGKTSGVFKDGGMSHTKEQQNFPWWEVDLGQEYPIDSVVIWNRSEEDGKYASRLDGFKLLVLDEHRLPAFAKDDLRAPLTSARFDLDGDPAHGLRLAALNAITAIPGHEGEVFSLLAGYIKNNQDRDAAVRSLRRIPRGKWPAGDIKPLAEFIVAFVKKIPAKERTEPNILDILQLGNDLAIALPPADAKSIRAELGELGVQVILVRAVPHRMVYDRSKIYVEAGKPAVIVFENSDIMPHNLLIVTPGSMAEMGLAAEKMANDPDAFAKGFVPASPKVLHATRLLQPRETERLQFVAPQKPGEYQYVCTFPGHWRIMNGTLHVVPKLADIAPSELNPPTIDIADARPFVRNWTVEELTPSLIDAERERNFERGKELFKIGSCLQCHKMQKDGGNLGPDLTDIPKKLIDRKLTRIDLLREVLEPSKVIDEKYRPYAFITVKGEVVSGVIVHQDGKILRIASNPIEKPREIRLADIDEKQPSTISIMPNGLLVTFDREEILDLMAYLIAGGDVNHPAFSRRKE